MPAIWNIPYPRNPYFTGREELLSRLAASLRTGQTVGISQPQAVSGLGGVGKTQISLEYAYRYYQDYDAVLWTRADTQEALISGFVVFAALLQLPQQEERDQLKIVQAVKGWLMNHTRWLLLLDNADDLALVQEFLPPAGRGHTLLTTRAASTGRLAQRIEVDPLDLEPGALLLLRRADRLGSDATLEQAEASERAVALEITKELGGLPLALDQAGAYIEETRCGLTDYLLLYRSQRTGLLKSRGGLVPDHPDSVATTWSMAFQQVERDQPAAIELMRLCAFLAPDAIPEELIVEGAPHLGPVLQPVAADRGRLNEALAALLKYSLLRRDATTHTLIIHRLVQAVILDELDEETQRRWAERVVRAVRQIFLLDEPAPWPLSQRYLAHALACEALIKQWDLTIDEAAAVLNNAGCYLRSRGQYREAEPLQQDALAIGEKRYGHDHPSTYYLLNNLAEFYREQGKYEQAEPLYQRALAIMEKVLGPEHPDTATTLNNLANLYRAQAKVEEAEPLFQRSLAIREKTLGPEHPFTATTLYNLGELYRAQGKVEEAEPLFQRALAIDEKTLGPEHSFTIRVREDYAILLRKMGRESEASQLEARFTST